MRKPNVNHCCKCDALRSDHTEERCLPRDVSARMQIICGKIASTVSMMGPSAGSRSATIANTLAARVVMTATIAAMNSAIGPYRLVHFGAAWPPCSCTTCDNPIDSTTKAPAMRSRMRNSSGRASKPPDELAPG